MTAKRCTMPPSGQAATAAAQYRAPLPVLETERLVLRTPDMNDLPAWTKICNDAFGDGEEEAWTSFSYYTACWLLHGYGLFTVTRKTDGEVLGFVQLGLEWGDFEPELGYMFDAAHHRKGFATEACTAVRDFGFDLLGRGAFVSYVKDTNARSNAMAARLGAVRDHTAETEVGPGHHVWRHGDAE